MSPFRRWQAEHDDTRNSSFLSKNKFAEAAVFGQDGPPRRDGQSQHVVIGQSGLEFGNVVHIEALLSQHPHQGRGNIFVGK
jgi:hypothetical protein